MSLIKVKTTLRNLNISKRMQKRLSKKGEDDLLDVLIDGGNDIRNTAIAGMQSSPPTGKLYTGGGRSAPHRASSPGEFPRVDTGDLLRSIIVEDRINEIEVGSIITDPPYPQWLEDGTDIMEPRPWLAPAITAHEDDIRARAGGALDNVVRGFGRGL